MSFIDVFLKVLLVMTVMSYKEVTVVVYLSHFNKIRYFSSVVLLEASEFIAFRGFSLLSLMCGKCDNLFYCTYNW